MFTPDDMLHLFNFRKLLFTFWNFSFQNVSNQYCEWTEDFQEIITLENRLMFARLWRWTGFTVSWRTCALSSIFILNLVLILPTLVGLFNSPNPGKSIEYSQPYPGRLLNWLLPTLVGLLNDPNPKSLLNWW